MLNQVGQRRHGLLRNAVITGWLMTSLVLCSGFTGLARETKPSQKSARSTKPPSTAARPTTKPSEPKGVQKAARKPASPSSAGVKTTTANAAKNKRVAGNPGTVTKAATPTRLNPQPSRRQPDTARQTAPSAATARTKQARVSAEQTAKAKRGADPRRSYETQATAGRRSRAHAEHVRAMRRRAEQARLAELARIRALDESLQHAAQSSIEQDDLRGEDPTIRQIALNALGGRAGTVVVMEPATGQVLSIVNQQWAIRTPFKPCSTIKVLTAYAALQEQLTTADEAITTGGQSWTLRTAMARSNNEYFQVLGRRLGFERVVAYAQQAGFGRKTGINLPGETSGVIPRLPPADMGRTCSHGDGFGVTAIQLATFISAIANGGTLYRPQILRSPQDTATFKPIPVKKLALSEQVRGDLLAGMVSAVERGTARRSGAAAFGVAGKTGSCNCDFGARTRVGLFVSFVDAPGKPGLLVTVITKGSTARGSNASVIAGEVYRGAAVASRTKLRPRVVPTTNLPGDLPDADSDEEDDESND
ncbi:MAG: penicillin-binding transpeptidase domain-containing protein [Chloracidobacterium sp.]